MCIRDRYQRRVHGIYQVQMGASFAKDQSINFTEEEIKKLYQKFKELDVDESGTLEPNEFFDVPELSQNPIVHRVIDVFDKNKDGKISFTEFISGLSSLHSEGPIAVSYTHLRAHETSLHLVCRLLLEKKKKHYFQNNFQLLHQQQLYSQISPI
eukprot:TRINITY_DN3829_c0_g1_i2.p2 TRINITY_DN3829_c0_g1~~TRINITY_DN3829_c0_g1_i2.p2  ORF type:complete len:154 (-),score=26.82 TRINITY_DN3829_c0_g1_i2:51-512(-)